MTCCAPPQKWAPPSIPPDGGARSRRSTCSPVCSRCGMDKAMDAAPHIFDKSEVRVIRDGQIKVKDDEAKAPKSWRGNLAEGFMRIYF